MNMIIKLVSAGLVFAFAGIYSPASIQSEEAPLRGPASFSAYDEDGDGSVSEEEFSAMHRKRMESKTAAGMPMRGAANPPSFSDFDTDDDGRLTEDELAAGQKARMGNRQGMAKGTGQGCCCGGGMKMGKGMQGSGGMKMGKGMQGCCGGGMGKGMQGCGGMKMGKGMQGCCGGGMGKGMQGGGGMKMGKGMMQGCNMSRTRHHFVMRNGVDKNYVDRTNPLEESADNAMSGKKLYEKNCASCHGATGLGDGKAGKGLNPGPTNIAMFSKMPMASDGYLLWTISEGGAPVQSAMPAFKNKLKQDDMWKIITYLRQL
ncbi:MAG: cytochrome c [Mariprofundaceae bacterium]|nr:cytochrome c [Mariprofundaceae bacterium]